LTFLPIELFKKIANPYIFGIVGILKNSAFHYSVEKGRSPIILKNYQALKVKKRDFGMFLAFGPIFGGLLIKGAGKNGIFGM